LHPLSQPHLSPAAHHLIRRLSVILTASTVAVTAVVPSAATAAPAPPADTGQLIQLDSLGGRGSAAADVNQRGDLTGTSGDAAGNSRAVVWRHGEHSPTALGVDRARPAAINENGDVAGYVDGGLFLWRAGAVTYLSRGDAAYLGEPSLNDSGHVAGTATDEDGVSRAFRWQDGRMTMLPTPAGMSSTAVDINNKGQVVGTLTRPGSADQQAVLWQNGRMVRLGTLGGAGSAPVAINERGQVIGHSAVAGSPQEHPFLWQRGRMTDLLTGTKATGGLVVALNDASMMTGRVSYGDHDSRPVLWRDGGMTDIGLPGRAAVGVHLNDRGDVTGSVWANPDGQGAPMPFRWRDGRTTLFPEPPGDVATTVVGIDRDGVIGVELETTRSGMIVLRSA
jgi:probable HAF family extracellular repeat protein